MAAVIRPRLDELPEELISNIAVKLDTDSSYSFRLTCKALEAKSLHEWATEYFAHKAIVPSTASLKVLVGIAESEKLRGFLHHLYIIPGLFAEKQSTCCHGLSCKSHHTTRQEEAMLDYISDQKHLSREGRLQERFEHIFKQLTELHNVMFADNIRSIPAEVDIIGHVSFARRTKTTPGISPAGGEAYFAWKSYAWKAMVQAIAFSGISTLKSLSTLLDKINNALTLQNVNFNGRTLFNLREPLRNLKAFSLQMTSLPNDTTTKDRFDKAKATKLMQNIAKLIPSVDSLDLIFSYNPASFTMCQTFMDEIHLSKLKKLRLEGVYTGPKFLGTLICALVNVENLQLEYINLTKGAWPTMLEALLKLKKLNHLHVTHVGVPSGAACFLSKEKKQSTADGAAPPNTVSFDGQNMTPFPDFGYDGPEDENSYDGSEDEDEDDSDADTDDSMPELEPQTNDEPTLAAVQPSQPGAGATAALTVPPAPTAVDHSSGDETDDSMPDLEPQPQDEPAQTNAPPAQPAQPAQPPANQHTHSRHINGIHTPPLDPNSLESRLGVGTERGIVICLKTNEEIQQLLRRFIKEYRIIDYDDEELDDMYGPYNFPNVGMAMGVGPVPAAGGAAGAIPGAGAGAGAAGAAAGGVGAATGAGTGTGLGVGTAGGQGGIPGAMPFGPPPPQLVNQLMNALGMPPGTQPPGFGFTMSAPVYGPVPPPGHPASMGAAMAAVGGAYDDEDDDEDWLSDDE